MRKTSEDGHLLVNHREVSEIILQDGDLIGLGLSGPQIRFRLPRRRHRRHKPILHICRDCVDIVKLADVPAHRKISVFVRHVWHDMVHQTTRLFRWSTLVLLLTVGSVAGGYVWWNNQQFRHYENSLARLAEQSEKERRTLKAELEKLEETSRQVAAEGERRLQRMKESMDETGGQELRRLAKELEKLRGEFDFAPSLVARYSSGVCFIVGQYGFAEKTSGRMLRFAGFDPQGVPLRDPSGQVRLEVGDGGVPLSRFYTGSGFLATRTGHILTNRHVAEPWTNDEADQEIIRTGFDPVWLVFQAYFPGHRAGYPLQVVKHSKAADVSLLKTELGKSHPSVLSISPTKPRSGEPILLLGYPAGYEAMLARYSKQTIESIVSERPSSLDQLAQAMARRNLIRPIATQGHLGDVLPHRLVYDAQTTHGGSGGPIFNSRGEVIGVNFAALPAFGGSNFGVPAELILPLLPR
ncbi:MAG: trypsin-like peptidase domain-containing protein [Acidobacteria bacterium]|nr:trypsin-like peptidase domain-containing protein [Acidobacteriota bacterium]